MKSSTTIVIAAFLVCLSAGLYLAAGSGAPKATPDTPTREAPEAPPPPAAPYVSKNLPPPKVSEIKNPAACFDVVGDRYRGKEVEAFGKDSRDGVTVYNGCKDDIVIVDVKTNDTSYSFVASALPVRAILRGSPAKQEKDQLLALSRSGARCDQEGTETRICRFVTLPSNHSMFFTIPYKHWFSIPLLDGRTIGGYLLEPVDPKAPPKPKEVPKMPDKGFKFRRL